MNAPKREEFQPRLIDFVRDLLRNRSQQETLANVESATGIPASWLGKFASPSTNLKRVPADYAERLYFHYTKSHLIPVTDELQTPDSQQHTA